jgi:hypothetical protein
MKKPCFVFAVGLLVTHFHFFGQARAADNPPPTAADSLEARLAAAGTNRAQIALALKEAPAEQQAGLQFLLQSMPGSDLQTVSAGFLLENLKLAYEAWEQAPWHSKVSPDLFFNDVLPYACMNEKRESWRARLRAECLPMIAGAKSPGEAAHLLNQKIFPHFNVKYNTTRHRPDQSPGESIASGKATCTGLSILLVDACRAVGIPARVAGTPMWTNMRGNHTWVEIWDNGWHFAGAAEPDNAGLDHGWFVGDASKAQTDVPQHSIYATSWKKTGVYFPLVWLPGDKSVNAENVTDRYTASSQNLSFNSVTLAVKVTDAAGQRVTATVSVTDAADPTNVCSDRSRSGTADLNDFVSFKLVPGHRYRVVGQLEGKKAETEVTLTHADDQLVTLVLPEKASSTKEASPTETHPAHPLSTRRAAALQKELQKYFTASPARQAAWKFASKWEKLLADNEPEVRKIAWGAYRQAPVHRELHAYFGSNIVTFDKYLSPYTVKKVGERPAKGWPLFIAMHGGGNAPKELNDSQWKHMQIYYKDHPELGGYQYLALRAPNDTWNGFYDDYVYPLIDQLILQFRLFGDIDPNKVFIMGYSHGGYGAYAIGPKMPDRFAAIHASAAAATDGETTAETLRTTPFTAMVGEKDSAYGRYERNVKFRDQVKKLRGDRTDTYPVSVTIVQGNGHTGLPDRDKIVDMYPVVRNPVPAELTWLMTDSVVKDFFWLHVPKPGKQQEVLASFSNNRFVVTANERVESVTVLMDSRMVDLRKPIDIELNGSTVTRRRVPSLKTFCQTLARRGDPEFAFSAELVVEKNGQGQLAVQ